MALDALFISMLPWFSARYRVLDYNEALLINTTLLVGGEAADHSGLCRRRVAIERPVPSPQVLNTARQLDDRPSHCSPRPVPQSTDQMEVATT